VLFGGFLAPCFVIISVSLANCTPYFSPPFLHSSVSSFRISMLFNHWLIQFCFTKTANRHLFHQHVKTVLFVQHLRLNQYFLIYLYFKIHLFKLTTNVLAKSDVRAFKHKGYFGKLNLRLPQNYQAETKTNLFTMHCYRLVLKSNYPNTV
jgi:hypothetical protein